MGGPAGTLICKWSREYSTHYTVYIYVYCRGQWLEILKLVAVILYIMSVLFLAAESWCETGLGIRSFALWLFALELFAISLFALSLFALSLFALCSLLFALSLFLSTVYPSYYRATVSDSLPSVLTKEREWANRSHHHHRHEWLTRDSSKSLSKMSHSFEKMHTFCIFLTIFYFIFPLFIK